MEMIYGMHAVEAILRTAPKTVVRLLVQDSRGDHRLLALISMAEKFGVSVKRLPRSEIDNLLSQDVRHQGVVAEVSELPEYSEQDLKKIIDIEDVLLLILDGVQDPHNLGACLRSANAMGVHAVIAPKDRAVGMTPTVRKVACGAAEITPFIAVTNLSRTMEQLKDAGIWLVGAAGEAETVLHEIDLKGKVGLIMGAEGKGLRRLTKDHCDYLARIPMQGSVSSLNVSVATGICLYEINRQRDFTN